VPLGRIVGYSDKWFLLGSTVRVARLSAKWIISGWFVIHFPFGFYTYSEQLLTAATWDRRGELQRTAG
jgi:hypothetical protein